MPRTPRSAATHKVGGADQPLLELASAVDEHLPIGLLETLLWDAACAIRGATDAPKFA